MIGRISDPPAGGWDVLVIGGGATGLGAALDSATRGYRTLLLEGGDFAKGTSGRSTKIIHGGVRYLRQGNIRLVRDSLRERGLLIKNCPELVVERGFVVPHYRWWERFFYGMGMKVYDMLSGGFRLSRSRRLPRREIRESLPTLNPDGLRGGTLYFDGQFDDARLAVALARAVADHGGTVANYVRVTGFLKGEGGKICGVAARDLESGREYAVESRAVINATGVFSDSVRRMDDPGCATLVTASQGIHIVLDRRFLPSGHAVMIPKTDDGRLLFIIPWNGKVLVGTTDTPRDEVEEEPRPLEEEIAYMLDHLGRYMRPAPGRGDISSTFAGLRPLVRPPRKGRATSQISRDHTIEISPGGLVTIVGGKWTTYRLMAEDVIDRAAEMSGLGARPCRTRSLPLEGRLSPAGGKGKKLHPRLEITEGDVVEAVRGEMARTVEDVLSRRTRALVLDARAAMEVAPSVAEVMARELGRDGAWVEAQLATFRALAGGYLVGEAGAVE